MIVIRPISPSDLELETNFVRSLSRQTGFQRLHSPRTPSDEELRHWTDVDGVNEVALLAVAPAGQAEEQMGVARFVLQSDGESAEFAIVLGDKWQGRGIGRQLLERLVDEARKRGIKQLVGTALSTNRAMIHLAVKLGFDAKRVRGDATVTELSLQLNKAASS